MNTKTPVAWNLSVVFKKLRTITISSEQQSTLQQFLSSLTAAKALSFAAVGILAICLLALLVSVVLEISDTLFEDSVLAQDGILDLSELNIEQSDAVPLAGEWDFFWQQFVLPTSYQEEMETDPHASVVAPFAWKGHVHLGEELDARGFATYRLRINLPPSQTTLSLYVPPVGTAHRLYINQALVDEVGVLARTKRDGQPDYAPKVINFQAPDGKVDIIWQVSNHHLAWGGQWTHMTLGSIDAQYNAKFEKLIRSVSIAAIFFTISVLSLFQFALRPSDSLPFLLACSCIVLGLREIETSGVIYMIEGLSLSFEAIVRINFLTFYLAILVSASYFYKSYPQEFQRLPVFFICGVSLLFVFMTLIFEPDVFSEFMQYFQIFAIFVLTYGVCCILLAAYRRRTGAILLAFGSLLLFVLSINDILYSLKLIDTGIMAGLGLLSFAFCQNFLTYMRFINDRKAMLTLRVTANQDPLTLLLNRRGLMKAISAYVDEASRPNTSSLIIIDFDNFKALNDTHGHDRGDLVLKLGSRLMVEMLDTDALAARWGGEEFVIYLPNNNLEQAYVLGESLRVALGNSLSREIQSPISTSIGVAQWRSNESFDECLKRADVALYTAKESGRNQVVCSK